MKLFNSLFGVSDDEHADPKVGWLPLTDVAQLENIIKESYEKPVLIFKHSTRCGISRMALGGFEKEFDLQDKVRPYFLDLLQHRDVSDAISQQFNIVHQSPQLLLISNGKSIYDASHGDIDAGMLGNLL